jgi:hypothetical protein
MRSRLRQPSKGGSHKDTLDIRFPRIAITVHGSGLGSRPAATVRTQDSSAGDPVVCTQ